jgi:pyruvate oxidase
MSARCLQNVADVFAEQLSAWGVRFVYGIPGGSVLPVVDAIRRRDDIRFILVRHESTAAYMASAYAKLTGRLGVCTAISGAGAANLITGLADAAWDRAPVLAITGQVSQDLIGSGVFQEIDQYGLFASLAVYNEVLQDPAQVTEVLPAAMKAALVRRGVAHIGIPVNLQREGYCNDIILPGNIIPQPGPARADQIEKAAEIIGRSSRPVILAGSGATRQELALLSDRLSAPVATTPSAKGLFNERSPLSLGVLGRLGFRCSIEAFAAADLAILIGADITEQRLIPHIPAIQIISDPLDVANDLHTEAVLAGDIRLTIQALIDLLPAREPQDAPTSFSTCRSESGLRITDYGLRIHPRSAIDALAQHASEDAVISIDIGDVTYWYMQFFPAVRQHTLISSHLAAMAFAFPAALAAQLEYPHRQVISICGDGGFAMNMADFTTAVKYELPVTVLLLNNNSYGRVVGEEREAGLPEYATDLLNPDFAAYATSCGGLGIRVQREEDLDDAIRTALESDLPALVEVLTDPSIHPTPTLPPARE